MSSSATVGLSISHSSERWVVGAKQRWHQEAALHFEQKTYLVGEWVVVVVANNNYSQNQGHMLSFDGEK